MRKGHTSATVPSPCTRKLRALLVASALPYLGGTAMAAKTPSQTPPSAPSPGLTVEELLHHASQGLANGAWEAAITACHALLRDYGDRPEISRLKERIHLTLLRCHLNLGQWAEAAPLFEDALHCLSAASPQIRGELLFQKTACELRLEQPSAALKSINECLQLLPQTHAQRPEAVLLQATALLGTGMPIQAGELLETALPPMEQPLAQRALPLAIRAFLEANLPKRAYTLHTTNVPRLLGVEESITLQLLLLQMSEALLGEGSPREALACLERILPPQRLIQIQKQRLTALEQAIARHQASPAPAPQAPLTLQAAATQIRKELESFGEGKPFAAATRLQIAAAYQALERPHEAALVLEDALHQLPPAEILEHAALELAKIWLELERWQRVVDVSTFFANTYPSSKHLPLLLYLRGCAEQKAGRFAQAMDSFALLQEKFNGHELSANARFMQHFTLLLDNRPEEAAQGLASFLQTHQIHALAEPAAHWLCVARSQSGPPTALRAATSGYLERFPKGENRSAILLRHAQAAHALGERESALKDLERLLSETPEDSCAGEAALLLGDELQAVGDTQSALAAWSRVPPSQLEAREEALLKSAKLLHRNGRFQEVRDLLGNFGSEQAKSPRLAEAWGWIKKSCIQQGQPQEAIEWIFPHLTLGGNAPEAAGIERLLATVTQQWGTASESEAWQFQLETLVAAAEKARQPTLTSRLKWALALQLEKQDPQAATRLRLEAASLAPPALIGSAVLADAAEALENAGSASDAEQLWRELLKWHPQAVQRDRALYRLAYGAWAGSKPESAWEWVKRFETAAPHSPLLPRILLLQARLQHAEGKTADALRSLETLLRHKSSVAATKCESLFLMGEIHLANGSPRLAIPYLQRVYVSYGRLQPWAAKAYLASAEAFSALGENTAARNSYTELLASELAPDAPERILAASRLKALPEAP